MGRVLGRSGRWLAGAGIVTVGLAVPVSAPPPAAAAVVEPLTGTRAVLPDHPGADGYPVETSADGTKTLVSTISGLVAGDTDGLEDVYVLDDDGSAELVSSTASGANVGGSPVYVFAGSSSMSADGRRVCFVASDGSAYQSGVVGVATFVKDLDDGSLLLAGPGDSSASECDLSADGERVFFLAPSTYLGGSGPGWDLYMRELGSGAVEKVTVDAAGNPFFADDWSGVSYHTTSNGSVAVFEVWDSETALMDYYRRNVDTNTTTLFLADVEGYRTTMPGGGTLTILPSILSMDGTASSYLLTRICPGWEPDEPQAAMATSSAAAAGAVPTGGASTTIGRGPVDPRTGRTAWTIDDGAGTDVVWANGVPAAGDLAPAANQEGPTTTAASLAASEEEEEELELPLFCADLVDVATGVRRLLQDIYAPGSMTPSLVLLSQDGERVAASWIELVGATLTLADLRSWAAVIDIDTGEMLAVDPSRHGGRSNGAITVAYAMTPTGDQVLFGSTATNLLHAFTTGSAPVVRPYHRDLDVGDFQVRRPPVAPTPRASLGTGSRTSTAPAPSQRVFAEDPVEPVSGNFVHPESDLVLPGGIGIEWTRVYNSLDDTAGVLGSGWTTVVDQAVTVDADGNAAVRLADGREVVFGAGPGGTWVRPFELEGDLTGDSATGWTLRLPNGTTTDYGAGGSIAGWSGPRGSVAVVRTAGRVVGLDSSWGPSLDLEYDLAGTLVGLEADDGRTVGYGRTGGALSSVTAPNGATTTYTHDTAGRLATIVDAAGVTTVANTYDEGGRVLTQSLPGAGSATFDYDAGSLVTTVTNDQTGEVTAYAWSSGGVGAVGDAEGAVAGRRVNAYGQVESQTTRTGETITFEYDERGNLVAATAPTGAVTTHAYDAEDRLVETVAADGGVTSYTYTGVNRVPSTITDPEGGVTTQTLVGGRVTEVVDADGVEATYTFTADGLVDTVTDGVGGVTDHDYDAAGRLVRIETPGGAVTQRTYDASGWLLSETAPDGGVTAYTYDDAGRRTSVTRADGGVTTTAYDGFGRVASITDPLGQVTTWGYDDLGQVLTVTAPGGATTTNTWGPMGRLASASDPTGVVTSYEYDASGRRIATTTPAGTSTTTYDDAGLMVATTDALGRGTAYDYDVMDRVVATTDPAGGVTTVDYDLAGRTVVSTDAEGGATTSAYSDAGRLVGSTDPTGVTTTFRYDAAGRQVGVADDAGNETVSVLDADGHVIQVVSPEGRTVTTTYDAMGRALTETDGVGVVTTMTWSDEGALLSEQVTGQNPITYVYDDAGQLTQVTDGRGGVTTFGYDGRGNRTTMVDARGETWTTAWDLADRKVSETDPNGAATTFTYDGAGRLDRTVDASGRSIDNEHDAAGQVTTVTYDDAVDVDFTYDPAGRRASMTDPTGTTTWTTDLAGRTLSEVGPDADAVTSAYDAAGRRTSLTAPGRLTTYTYDSRGMLDTVTAGALGTTDYTWDRDGLLITEDAPGAALRAWFHDAAGRASVYHDTDGVNVEMTYRAFDSSGRPKTDAWTDGRIRHYAHDPAGQLYAALSSTDGAQSWTYDANGNRTGECQSYVCWTHTYDDAGRRTATTSATPVGAYTTEVAADTPLGWWRLGESAGTAADDRTTGNHDGTYYATTLGSAGAIADDPDDAVEIGTASAIYLPTPAVSAAAGHATTIELWVRPTSAAPSYLLIAGNVVVSTAGSRLYVSVGTSGHISTDAGLTVGQWSHLTLVLVNGNLAASQLTVDGFPTAWTTTGTLGSPALTTWMVVGAYGTYGFQGDVDEVAVYDGALAPARRAAHFQAGVGDRTYTWDLAGRMLTDADGRHSRSFAYDAMGRLSALTETVGTDTWVQQRTYDGTGRLADLTNTTPSAPTPAAVDLTWDGVGAVPQLVELGNQALTWGVGGLLAGPSVHVGRDLQGSVIRGVPADSARYDSFGVASTRATIDEVSIGYRGELTTGDLVHLRARDYAPTAGAFTTADPLDGVAGTSTIANLYHYANNDPLEQVDPLGLRAEDEDFDKPEYWGNARPKILRFGMPVFEHFRHFGTAIIAGFIPQEETPVLPRGGGPRFFSGDGRDFTDDGMINPYLNRFYLEVNFANGSGFAQVNPTCRASEDGFFYGGGCASPFDIVLNDQPDLGLWDAAFQGRHWDKNYVNLEISENERAFRASWSVVHSSEGVGTDLMRPRADGRITIETNEDGWSSSYDGDCFPSIELVRELRGDREILGQMRDRGAVSMSNTVSWLRHRVGAYC